MSLVHKLVGFSVIDYLFIYLFLYFCRFSDSDIIENHVYSAQDFYLDLTEDGRRITPRDYLESALQPIPGSGKAIASKNEVSSVHSYLLAFVLLQSNPSPGLYGC